MEKNTPLKNQHAILLLTVEEGLPTQCIDTQKMTSFENRICCDMEEGATEVCQGATEVRSHNCGTSYGTQTSHGMRNVKAIGMLKQLAILHLKMLILPRNTSQGQHEERERGGAKQGNEDNANSANEFNGYGDNFSSPR